MSTGRMIVRAAVSAVASLALVMGVGGASAVVAAETSTVSAAERCTAEKQDVRKATKKFKKAKKAKNKAVKKYKKAKKTRTKADDRKAAKVKKKAVKKFKKTRKNLKRQKAQRAHWCDRAHNEKAAQTELSRLVAVFQQLQSSEAVAALPAEVRTPMDAAIGEVLVHLATLSGQIPGAEPDALAQLVTNLQSLDPTQLQAAVQGLATEIQSSSDPSMLQALVDGLLGGVLGSEPDGLAEVEAAFKQLVAALQGLDPSASGQPLKPVEEGLAAAIAALQNLDDSGTLAPIVSALTAFNGGTLPSDPAVLTDLLAGLATLNGGTLPTAPADLTGLIEGLIGGTIPTDGLPDGIGDVFDDIIGGLPITTPELPGLELPGLV